MILPRNGVALFVKRDCPTCVLIDPVAGQLEHQLDQLVVLSQDDPQFPEAVERVIDDSQLEQSWRNSIEIVPTLIRFQDGKAVERCEGWHRAEWEELTGASDLGEVLGMNTPLRASVETPDRKNSFVRAHAFRKPSNLIDIYQIYFGHVDSDG